MNLKDKIQQLIEKKEKQELDRLKNSFQQFEDIGTLKRLRDFEGEELLMCLGWLSVKHNRPQLTSQIKENLLAAMETEVSLIENSNLLAQQLTDEELLKQLSLRIKSGKIKSCEVGECYDENDYPRECSLNLKDNEGKPKMTLDLLNGEIKENE